MRMIAPPIVGTISWQSGQCRLRVRAHTDGQTLRQHVHDYTQPTATGYTDEWQGYNRLNRSHSTVCHGQKAWARDDDGDGVREVHLNTIEGLWTTARNFLRPFRGVHKQYLQSSLAICEHRINRNRISPQFLAQLVAEHQSIT